jgi:hypothetical protein
VTVPGMHGARVWTGRRINSFPHRGNCRQRRCGRKNGSESCQARQPVHPAATVLSVLRVLVMGGSKAVRSPGRTDPAPLPSLLSPTHGLGVSLSEGFTSAEPARPGADEHQHLRGRKRSAGVHRSARSALARERWPENRKWEDRCSIRNKPHCSEATGPSCAVRRRTMRSPGTVGTLGSGTREVRACITCTYAHTVARRSRRVAHGLGATRWGLSRPSRNEADEDEER